MNVEFNIICGFWHPLGTLECFPQGLRGTSVHTLGSLPWKTVLASAVQLRYLSSSSER